MTTHNADPIIQLSNLPTFRLSNYMSSYNARVLVIPDTAALEAELGRIEPIPEQIRRAAGKGEFRVLRLDGLPYRAAIILKQELLAVDADAIISPRVYLGERDEVTGALVFGTRRQYSRLLRRLRAFSLPDLEALAVEIAAALDAYDATQRGELVLRGRRLGWGERTFVMGILNITPNSFSGDGLARDGDPIELALEQARGFAASGVDILDVGGESTRPGAEQVEAERECERVVPVIRALRAELDLPISIDTYKAVVAAAALEAGADLINDVWGLRTPDGGWNEPLARLVAEHDTGLVIMHNRRAQASAGSVGGHYKAVAYDDLHGDILRDLRESIAFARAHGVRPGNIIVDPGIGFGKTPAQNIELLRRLGEFRSLGYPLLLGTSRKSFIGIALGGAPPEERLEGTAATIALGIHSGADIVRVHDVAAMVKVARMTDAIVRR